MERMEFFSNMTNVLWGNYGFQALFYLSLLLILILEQRHQHKVIGFWYSICILLAIYNPIMYNICKYIFASNDLIAYYCRLFCLIPIVFVIAYAFVLLLNHTSEENKIYYIIIIIFILFLCGHDVYREDWFVKASNVNKVPEDVLQINNLFQNQNGPISIMVPNALTVYMRQINSDFSMPYGRNGRLEISCQLESEAPNVQEVLEYATSTETEYIVALYNESARKWYSDAGCIVIGYTDHYMVLQRI